MGKVIDFRNKKREKIIKRNREYAKKIKKENEEIMKNVVEKGILNLSKEEQEIFSEIMHVSSFDYEVEENKYSRMYLTLFRDEMYILHDMLDGSFEFIGNINDMIHHYIR